MPRAAEAVLYSQESPEDLPLLSWSDIRRHTTPPECWVVIHGRVYNVAPVLATHPGGSQVLLNCAGRDATFQFDDVGHSMESLLYDMPRGSLKGVVEGSRVGTPSLRGETAEKDEREREREREDDDDDVEVVAQSETQGYAALWDKIYTLLLYCTILVSGLLLVCMRWRAGACEEVDEEVPSWVDIATSSGE